MADILQVQAAVVDICNSLETGWWNGIVALDDAKRSTQALLYAVQLSGKQVLRAIAANAKHGSYGVLSRRIACNRDEFLPKHDGAIGIPLILPYENAPRWRTGSETSPQQIDSYIDNPAGYTGARDGIVIPHDEIGPGGQMSPLACKYSLINEYFKFTGFSAEVPMVQLDALIAADADWFLNLIPADLEDAVIKLSPSKLVKEGDVLFQIAGAYQQLGLTDLADISAGATRVSKPPPPKQLVAQREAA